MTIELTTYRGYQIKYDPPPIPLRNWDWDYCPVDYDGRQKTRAAGGHALWQTRKPGWTEN